MEAPMPRSRLLLASAGAVPQWLPPPGAADPPAPARLDLAPPAVAGEQPGDLRTRRNQRDLSPEDWATLLDAVDRLAADGQRDASDRDGVANYQDFVLAHHRALATPPGLNWGVHAARRGDGRNFLPWHRRLLATFEERLRELIGDDGFALPYWDWVADPEPPKELSDPADLAEWGIQRLAGSGGGAMPGAAPVVEALAVESAFLDFSQTLEKGAYNAVHQWVGGTFATPLAPADPLFWLHHAFVDKLWAHWAAGAGSGLLPRRPEEEFHPNELDLRRTNTRVAVVHGTVGDVLDHTGLGYIYA
jgi:tyrosinase